jgi:FlaA1/EpsC-like NDP-sugar epimerase
VLEMGRPARIPDLAKTIIQRSGRGEEEIEVRFTSLRPGERLHGEVFGRAEFADRIARPSVREAKERPVVLAPLDALVGSPRVQVCSDAEAHASSFTLGCRSMSRRLSKPPCRAREGAD